jgi:hypothetical protein
VSTPLTRSALSGAIAVARAAASASRKASSLVSSNELRNTVPPAPRSAAITLSVVILRISRNNAALPDCRVPELLTRLWQQAKSAEGRVVLISGEPGIGKSRSLSESA